LCLDDSVRRSRLGGRGRDGGIGSSRGGGGVGRGGVGDGGMWREGINSPCSTAVWACSKELPIWPEAWFFPEMAHLDVNGDGPHDDEEDDTPEDDGGDGDGFAPAAEAAPRRGCLHPGRRRRVIGNGDVFAAVCEETAGVVRAFASAGHKGIESRRGPEEEEKNRNLFSRIQAETKPAMSGASGASHSRLSSGISRTAEWRA